MIDRLSLAVVEEASRRIGSHVLRTPVLTLEHAGVELSLKAESLQPTGSFKVRGAFNKMLGLPRDCAGVVAHSSGNHAQAVARAARVLGIPAVIVMPENAPSVKRDAAMADGAEIILVGPDSEERAERARALARERELVAVPPFDDPAIAAGAGTCALELVEQAGRLDRFYAPVSGGGRMAGCSVAVSALCPEVEIIGVEPSTANDTSLSFAAGERVTVDVPETIADGLCVRRPGELTFPVLRRHVRRIELVSDDEMLDAMAFAITRLHLVLEPSGAAALAVALREAAGFASGRAGVILSGGNADPVLLASALQRAKRAGFQA